MNYNKKLSGFTLIEMLVTIAISGVLLATAMPYFSKIIINNKTQRYSSEFSLTLFLAQNEAIKRGVQVTVKPKVTAIGNKWQGGWLIFTDSNANGVQDVMDELIKSYVFDEVGYTLKATDNVFANYVGFSSTGSPVGVVDGIQVVSNGRFVLCRPDNNHALSHIIHLTFAGNIRVSQGVISGGMSFCQ